MAKQFYKAKDLAEILGISESKSYGLIRQMNQELEARGFLTCRGRIPAAYVRERFYWTVEDGEQGRIDE